MAERSTAGIVWMFFVVPILTGGMIVCVVVANVTGEGGRLAVRDWIGQVVWFGLLGLGLMTAPPAAGWQELRRRKCLQR